jgi:DNA-binding MarR family transcriptional regulator
MEDRGVAAEVIDLWALFVRVSQAVLAAVEADLKAAGFPPLAWYDALLELRRADPQGLRPIALERRMLLAQYNVSRLVDRLEREGLVRCARCPDDARGQLVHITEKGRALLDAIWPAYRTAIMARFADRLGPGEAEVLRGILERLRPSR